MKMSFWCSITKTIDIRIKTKNFYFILHRYYVEVDVDKAKGFLFPIVRGTLLPSFNPQCGGGMAMNWLWMRIKIHSELLEKYTDKLLYGSSKWMKWVGVG